MPHTPRTHQLAAGNVSSSGLTTIAVPPPGARWLIKYVNLVQYSGSASDLALWLAFDGDFSMIAGVSAQPSGSPVVFKELYGVAEAGQELQLQFGVGGGGGCYFHVGGLVFEL